MIQFVIKRSGAKESFDPEKIRSAVRLACREGGVADEEVEKIADAVLNKIVQSAGERQEIKSVEIRNIALKELDSSAPAAAAGWRTYEQAKR